eukprot:137836_1
MYRLQALVRTLCTVSPGVSGVRSQSISDMSSVRSFASHSVSQDVVVTDHGSIGKLVLLNRPKALNALNLNMVEILTPLYQRWTDKKDPSVIVMRGAGDKAFCAGGDVRAIYDARSSKSLSELTRFFNAEYELDQLIGELPPKVQHVALLDGITMGGGVGLSVHGRFRVATERTLFAMPETGLGLFPDVGGSHFLPRLARNFGVYLALTGARLKGADVFHAGIATHFVAHDSLDRLQSDLLSLDDSALVGGLIEKYSSESDCPPNSYNEERLVQIERLFDPFHESVEDILKNLDSDKCAWAQKQASRLRKMSPTSLKVTLEQIRRGSTMSFADCFRMERTMGAEFVSQHDFFEGVRAILVDKDQAPVWIPDTLEAVTPSMVKAYFEN